MNTASERETVETGFAMGGFGGNNFHGLGFLHAARKRELRPDMISCTSGQIDIVWKYLLACSGRLEEKYGVEDLAALAGNYSKVAEIRPRLPFTEAVRDVPELMRASTRHLADVESFEASPLGYLMNATINNLPARTLVPDIEPGTLEAMQEDLDAADIGIAFNSYDPTLSRETVYLNKRAQALMRKSVPEQSGFRKTPMHLTRYAGITTDGLLDALWLYDYGFEGRTAVDGAYFRMVMLAELSRARKIFVARPIQSRWTAEMPVTYGEKEDLKTEVFFNAAYLGERFRIELVNRHLEDDAFTKKFIRREGYHPIEIHEVEPRRAQSFVDYFSESLEMFNEACDEASKVFERAWPGDRRDVVPPVDLDVSTSSYGRP